MKRICDKRCIIGEGPIWNAKENRLYFTNAYAKEICVLDIYTGELEVRSLSKNVAAMAFDAENRLIVSREDGVFILNKDETIETLYDSSVYQILYANDMKIGPDGRIYVGTQSRKRLGISEQVDGRLYSIDTAGNVRELLNNLILSNGMEWSMDETRMYHTDSPTQIIREYLFDKESGSIEFSGREIEVPGVDGFTIDAQDNIYAACWGKGHVAVIDIASLKILDYIKVPANIPASCGFAGEQMDWLAVVTASKGADLINDIYAGCTFMKKMNVPGRKPYLFGDYHFL